MRVALTALLALVAALFWFSLRGFGPIAVFATPVVAEPNGSAIANVDSIQTLDNARWVRCFRGPGEAIHFRHGKVSHDGGRSFEDQTRVDVEDVLIRPERAFHVDGDQLYAAGGRARLVAPGRYEIDAWRSTDALQSLEPGTSELHVPGGPTREPEGSEWYGLYVYRNIVVAPDGAWLMSMYGNFEADRIEPSSADARHETTYMMRSFLVRSSDRGAIWTLVGTIAAPRPGDPVGEGFVEPTLAFLDDGRLLCVMRTGHTFPAYATWSEDGGHTWTPPLYTGLDRACDPCLIRLQDGRIALSWGRRYPAGWSMIAPEPDHVRFEYPGQGEVNLAISDDGGRSWANQTLATNAGSCYSTIIEVEPNVLLCQVDQWVWRVRLEPGI